MVSIAGIHGVWWLESAVAQNSSMASNMTSATNMTNTTMTGNMTANSGGLAKTHSEDGIKALESGDKGGSNDSTDRGTDKDSRIIARRNYAFWRRNERFGRWRFEWRNYAFESCRSIVWVQ